MKLLIVESPAKAKTISKYLDEKYTVKSSVGHIRDLPKSNKEAIDIKGGFVPHYQTIPGKEHIVEELQDLSRKATEVLIATDPDREGEAIAWHIKEICNLKNPKRIVFHEITKSAVSEAMKNPRKIDDNLRKAQEARRVLDRLFGYDLSGLIWKKVRYGLSAGRVQSPALRILMIREREINAFNPQDYWVITADTKTVNKVPLPLTCTVDPTEEKESKRILKVAQKGTWIVNSTKETETKRSPKPPFITSTLQQVASTRLGFAPSKTMMLAQRLYEAGHITYMRTDSTTLSKVAVKEILKEIEKKFGKEYVMERTFKTKSKSAQEAHEAIRPTRTKEHERGQNADQKRLYKLIWERTVASQMADANMMKTKITVNINDGEIPNFSINGSRTLFDGWFKGDPSATSEEVMLPKVTAGEELLLESINSEYKQTEPPKRYTEAGLVKELEKRGIGRPSTYASIIKTIIDRSYVEKEGKTLFPTDLGEVVSTFLEQNFEYYISDSFTAEMENELDEIAEGKRDYTKTLKKFYTAFSKELKSKEDIPKLTDLGKADKKYKCPTCGKSMIIKLGRGGKFISCSTYPDCKGALTIEGEKIPEPKETGEECPKCSNKLIERTGKFGLFVGCSHYPKCKYIKNDPEIAKKNATDVHCTECKDGMMTMRKGRFGEFYSCSEYPDCKYAIKAKPTGRNCKECGALMMEGTKTIPERCSVKTCPYHNPHKLEKAKEKKRKPQ